MPVHMPLGSSREAEILIEELGERVWAALEQENSGTIASRTAAIEQRAADALAEGAKRVALRRPA